MEDIHKPVFIINEDKCRTNIRRMKSKADNSQVAFRPHFKTHQSHEVGKWFREAGVDKICVSSLSMASYFADDDWKDIMVAFPVNVREISVINALAQKISLSITIADASILAFLKKHLTHAISYYIKVDVGSHRTGFDAENIDLIRHAVAQANTNPLLHFKGLVAHAGHTYQTQSLNEVHKIYHNGVQSLKKIKAELSQTFPNLIVSWGDTPSCSLVSEFTEVDEIRPGNFVFYDLMQFHLASCDWPDIAAVVAAPVVAVHEQRMEVVLYAGAVHLSKDNIKLHHVRVYGELVRFTHNEWERFPKPMYINRLSQEHAIAKYHEEYSEYIQPGELLGIIPVHSCLAANLHKNNMVEIRSMRTL